MQTDRAAAWDASVIVITYNHEKYIRQALDSVLNQVTGYSYEVLIGDDASTDGTQDILREYQRQYPEQVKLTLRETNLGATQNAYDLFLQSSGRYLATCEGDDYWTDTGKLQKQIGFLEANPQYIGCTHRCLLVNEEGFPLKDQKLEWVKEKSVFTLDDFEGLYLPGQTATFVRRNIFLKPEHDYSIFYKAHPMIGDRTTMLMYLLQGDIYQMKEAMSAYRRVLSKGAANLTSKTYVSIENRVQIDYDITCSLEVYAQQEFGVKPDFETRKRELLASGILDFLRHPQKSGWKTIRRMVGDARNKGNFVFCAFASIAKRIFQKCFL